MAAISTVPETYDIKHYSGDTLILEVITSAVVVGKVWDAELRASRDAATIDAVFVITPPSAEGAPAFLTLSSAEVTRLTSGAPLVAKRRASGTTYLVKQYTGVWDCQVSVDHSDPVTTVAQGTLTIELDVTRPA
jgi:hypothetical protein